MISQSGECYPRLTSWPWTPRTFSTSSTPSASSIRTSTATSSEAAESWRVLDPNRDLRHRVSRNRWRVRVAEVVGRVEIIRRFIEEHRKTIRDVQNQKSTFQKLSRKMKIPFIEECVRVQRKHYFCQENFVFNFQKKIHSKLSSKMKKQILIF